MPTSFEASIEQLIGELENSTPGELIYCRHCSAPITNTAEKISVGLSHDHRFSNPAGIIYAIGCFRNAPGCSLHGPLTEEHSWFGGYRWQVAMCAECLEHLGWYYQGRSDRYFFGLIVSRLVESVG